MLILRCSVLRSLYVSERKFIMIISGILLIALIFIMAVSHRKHQDHISEEYLEDYKKLAAKRVKDIIEADQRPLF